MKKLFLLSTFIVLVNLQACGIFSTIGILATLQNQCTKERFKKITSDDFFVGTAHLINPNTNAVFFEEAKELLGCVKFNKDKVTQNFLNNIVRYEETRIHKTLGTYILRNDGETIEHQIKFAGTVVAPIVVSSENRNFIDNNAFIRDSSVTLQKSFFNKNWIGECLSYGAAIGLYKLLPTENVLLKTCLSFGLGSLAAYSIRRNINKREHEKKVSILKTHFDSLETK